MEGKWGLEYPANNGLSAPWQLLGKKSRPLRIRWETDNGTGAEVTTVITPRVKEGRGVRVFAPEDASRLYISAIPTKNLTPGHTAVETLRRCPLPSQGFHQ